jgi:secreted trypsin-like serine protease
MPRRHLVGRVAGPAFGLATCIAGAAVAPTYAQSLAGGTPGAAEPLYEMQLDLSLNPTRTEAVAQPPGAPEGPSHEQSLSLEALVPDYAGGEPQIEPRARVVHGVQADRGQWPSAVSLSIIKEGGRAASLCAGTVIDSQWVLTAAHCIFDRHRGGVKSVRAATAFAKSNLPRQGEVRRIKSVIAHPDFRDTPRTGKASKGLVNDIALLELETPTTAPRQKLLAHAGQADGLAAGTTATVIGWGVTNPRRPDEHSDSTRISKSLLRADVPIADRGTCDAFLAFPGDVPTEPVFCAGDARGGPDACNGDSGGPVFVSGHAGEALQAGVVSWGDGCSHPGTYGAYASVAHFEGWIRKHVPKAQWTLPRQTSPALAAIAGATPGGPAAPRGQVTADLLLHPCKGVASIAVSTDTPGAAANRIKIGSCITVVVTSGATGHLAVFNHDNTTRETRQIFPNKYRTKQEGETPTRVRAGQVVRIPADLDGFNFKVTGPAGRNELIAIVVPEGANLGETTRQLEDMRPVANFDDLLDGIAGRTRGVAVNPRAPRAVGTRQYDVVE